jgi:hypothetical protein
LAKRQTSDIRKWAAVGAEQRLRQIADETTAIYRTFRELRKSTRRSRAGSRARGEVVASESRFTADPGSGNGGGVRKRQRRRKMSAEARKRISDAQKARWAKQKAGAMQSVGVRKKR